MLSAATLFPFQSLKPQTTSLRAPPPPGSPGCMHMCSHVCSSFTSLLISLFPSGRLPCYTISEHSIPPHPPPLACMTYFISAALQCFFRICLPHCQAPKGDAHIGLLSKPQNVVHSAALNKHLGAHDPAADGLQRIPKGMPAHANVREFIPHTLTVLVSLIKYYLFYLLSLTSKVHGEIFISKEFLYLNFEKEERLAFLHLPISS